MTVEMLWERDDAAEVLRHRFGHDDASDVERWVGDVLASRWGIRVDACERVVMSDHNALAWVSTDRGRLLAKWSVDPQRFPRLDTAARVTAWLGFRGVPVAAPLPTRSGALQVEIDGRSLHVQRVIDGALLDVDDDEQVAAAGAALARIHRELDAFPIEADAGGRGDGDADGTVVGPYEPVLPQVRAWLDSYPDHLPSRGADALAARLDGLPDAGLPVQLVHGDFRAANVLVEDGAIAGVLDLEELRMDHTVVELARSAVLLGTLFHDWGPVSRHTRRVFLDGYGSVLLPSDAERAWWDALVLWYSLALVPSGADPSGWRAAAEALLDG